MNFLKWCPSGNRDKFAFICPCRHALKALRPHFKKFITYQPLNIFLMCKRQSCRELVKL